VDLSTNRYICIAVAVLCAAYVAIPAAPAPAATVTPPEVTCTACVLVDDTGRILYARGATLELPNASTTKMTTALLVARAGNLDDLVTVSPYAAATGGGGLDLQAGETYTVRSLLYALLLSSSNDAAVALAEHAAGSEVAFVDEMNDLAHALGARHTHFANAHGLDAPGHYSSARDLARIAQALLRRPLLAGIVATPHTSIQGPAGSFMVDNRNVLLESYAGAVGVKTGYTAGAGDVLVAAARRHHRRLIAVAMNSASAAADDVALLDYGWERLARGVIVRGSDPIGELVYSTGSSQVLAGDTVRGYERPDRVGISFEASDDLDLPILPGQEVGQAIVSAGGRTIATIPAVAAEAVGAEDASWAVDLFSGLIGSAARVLDSVGAL
jgi:D-alanyl-D-alanine carboxypeptidase (penicillin-binding protein 5/6)